MRNRSGIWISILLVLFLSGCVSKKKYLAMETLKNQYVRQSTDLKKENTTLKSELESAEKEFEALKQNLYYSDSEKNDMISDMTAELNKMEAAFNRAQTELSRTRDLYKDQRYYNTQASNEITRLEFAIEQLKRDTLSLNYSLRLARERNDDLKARVDERVDQLNVKYDEIDSLKTYIAVTEGKAMELETRVAETNKKLEAINKSFIELRKEMLRAKGAGTIIDPAAEPNMIEISKILGHF